MDISKHRNFLLSEIKVNKPGDFTKFKEELLGFSNDIMDDNDEEDKPDYIEYINKLKKSRNYEEINKIMMDFYDNDSEHVQDIQNIIKKVINI